MTRNILAESLGQKLSNRKDFCRKFSAPFWRPGDGSTTRKCPLELQCYLRKQPGRWRCGKSPYDANPVEVPKRSQKPVLRRQCGNPAGKSLLRRQCGQLSSTHSKIQNEPCASQPYDQSVAIRSQNTMEVRPLPKKTCRPKKTLQRQLAQKYDHKKVRNIRLRSFRATGRSSSHYSPIAGTDTFSPCAKSLEHKTTTGIAAIRCQCG